MSDIKKLLSKTEEAGKPTKGERGLLINSLSLLSKKLESELRDCDSIIVDIAIQDLEFLQAENEALKTLNSIQENLLRASIDWMDQKGCPAPYDFRVAFETPTPPKGE